MSGRRSFYEPGAPSYRGGDSPRGGMPVRGSGPGLVVLALAVLVALAVAALLVWLTAPLWHSLIYGAWVNMPLLVLVGAGGLVCAFLYFAGNPGLSTLLGIGWLSLIVLYLALSGPLAQQRFLADVEAGAQEIERVPDTREVRYTPFEVARAKGLNSTTDSRYTLGEFEPLQIPAGGGAEQAAENQEYGWVAPRVPNGWLNTFTRNQNGVLTVGPDGGINQIGEEFRYGEGMKLWNNVKWQFHNSHYSSTKGNPYYVRTPESVEGGQQTLIASPYIEWSFEFPVMVPEWGGVLIAHPDGTIEDLSPEEAREDPRLAGERLYPKELARRAMDSWSYRGGLWNALVPHVNQTEMPERSDQTENPPPYLMPVSEAQSNPATEPGSGSTELEWVAAAEPHGASYSTHTMFFVDARTGEMRYREYGNNSSLLGPARTFDVLQSEFPAYRWGDGVKAVEARPVIRSGDLYWLIAITNSQESAISETALVSASGSNEVQTFGSYEETLAFLRGEDAAPSGESSGGAGEGSPPEESGSAPPEDLSGLSEEDLVRLIGEAAEALEERRSGEGGE